MDSSDDEDYAPVIQLLPRPSKASRNLLLSTSNDSDTELTRCVNSDDNLNKGESDNSPVKKSSSLILPLDVEHINAQHHHGDPHYPHHSQHAKIHEPEQVDHDSDVDLTFVSESFITPDHDVSSRGPFSPNDIVTARPTDTTCQKTSDSQIQPLRSLLRSSGGATESRVSFNKSISVATFDDSGYIATVDTDSESESESWAGKKKPAKRSIRKRKMKDMRNVDVSSEGLSSPVLVNCTPKPTDNVVQQYSDTTTSTSGEFSLHSMSSFNEGFLDSSHDSSSDSSSDLSSGSLDSIQRAGTCYSPCALRSAYRPPEVTPLDSQRHCTFFPEVTLNDSGFLDDSGVISDSPGTISELNASDAGIDSNNRDNKSMRLSAQVGHLDTPPQRPLNKTHRSPSPQRSLFTKSTCTTLNANVVREVINILSVPYLSEQSASQLDMLSQLKDGRDEGDVSGDFGLIDINALELAHITSEIVTDVLVRHGLDGLHHLLDSESLPSACCTEAETQATRTLSFDPSCSSIDQFSLTSASSFGPVPSGFIELVQHRSEMLRSHVIIDSDLELLVLIIQPQRVSPDQRCDILARQFIAEMVNVIITRVLADEVVAVGPGVSSLDPSQSVSTSNTHQRMPQVQDSVPTVDPITALRMQLREKYDEAFRGAVSSSTVYQPTSSQLHAKQLHARLTAKEKQLEASGVGSAVNSELGLANPTQSELLGLVEYHELLQRLEQHALRHGNTMWHLDPCLDQYRAIGITWLLSAEDSVTALLSDSLSSLPVHNIDTDIAKQFTSASSAARSLHDKPSSPPHQTQKNDKAFRGMDACRDLLANSTQSVLLALVEYHDFLQRLEQHACRHGNTMWNLDPCLDQYRAIGIAWLLSAEDSVTALLSDSLSSLPVHNVDTDVAKQFTSASSAACSCRDKPSSPPHQTQDTQRDANNECAMSELRNIMVEKELLESRLRKLHMEVSGLQAENILLKDKNTRCQERCQFLEAEVSSARNQQLDLQDKVMQTRRQEDRERYQTKINNLDADVMRLKHSMQVCQSENSTLQRELEAAKRQLQTNKSQENTAVVNNYRAEIKILKDELERSRNLLRQSETQMKAEVEKRRDASLQVIKLTEMKTLLLQQLENANSGTAAQKQVLSLEKRLKVTEERLHQERVERAAKLSQVEQRLINENAKYQNLLKQHMSLETQITDYRQTLDDLHNEQTLTADTYEKELSCLTAEKHKLSLKCKDLADTCAGLQAEKDTLSQILHSQSSSAGFISNASQNWESECQSLRKDLDYAESELKQSQRAQEALSNQVESLTAQLKSKQHTLEQTMASIKKYEHSSAENNQEEIRVKNKIESLQAEMTDLQAQLRHKTHLMDKMGGLQSNHHVELQSLRDNLAAANRQLTETSHQLKLTTVELEREKNKVQKLTHDLTEREQLLTKNIAELLQSGTISSSLYPTSPLITSDMLTQAEMRVRMVEYEQESVRHDLERANAAIKSLVTENTDLTSQLGILRQELNAERAQILQLSSCKADLERNMRLRKEERDIAVTERRLLEQDLEHTEVRMKETIQKLEEDAQRASSEYHQKYHSLDNNGKKMVIELETNKRLLVARNKEIEKLRDAIFRQKEELSLVQSRISGINDEYTDCRDEVNRLTAELTEKMKETSVTKETHQSLLSAHSKLQLEYNKVKKDLSAAEADLNKSKQESAELTIQRNQYLDKLMDSNTNLFEINGKVKTLDGALEAARTSIRNNKTFDEEVVSVFTCLRDSICTTASVASIACDTPLKLEKISRSTLLTEIEQTLRQMELIRQEIDMFANSRQSDKTAMASLTDQCRQSEEETYQLRSQIKSQVIELDTVRQHLASTRISVEEYREEKQALYQDVQDLIKQLSSKDKIIAAREKENQQIVEKSKHNLQSEKSLHVEQKLALESLLSQTKTQLEDCQKLLQEKEEQLKTYSNISESLEIEIRTRKELDTTVGALQSELSQSHWKHTSLENENLNLKNTVKQSKDELNKAQEQIVSLKKDMRDQKEEFNREIRVLNMSLAEHTQKYDVEKGSIDSKYQKTLSDLRAAEASIAAVTETKQSLATANQQLETAVQDLKSQLNEEITAKRLMEHKAKMLKSQLNETRESKAGVDELTTELQASVARLETELSQEQQKSTELKREIRSYTSTTQNQEQLHQSLQIELAESKTDRTSLANQLETCKQSLSGKIRRLQLDLKQQTDNSELERVKLVQQSQQLTQDLEQSRQLIVNKNRDNLSLQQENLSLTEKLRELQRNTRQSQDAMKSEQNTRQTLEKRIMELELLLTKLRSKTSDDKSFDSTRSEVSRKLTELSQKMQTQLEQQRDAETEARTKDAKRCEELKRKLESIECALSQEQALHIVTKTQLKSLDDDNQRLRQQLQATRRRVSPKTEQDRAQTRMEEINEIIARSQMRAQQLLASGAYDDPQRPQSS